MSDPLAGGPVKFAAIVEDAGQNFSAYLPEAPGCVAVGETPDLALESLSEALGVYLDELRIAGAQLPEPSALMATLVQPVMLRPSPDPPD